MSEFDVIVIGAGFSGLYAVYKAREEGLRVRGIEAAGGVGGVWYWNRYPGARCDIASVWYSFAFSPELVESWRWSEKYASQPEIRAYADHVADFLDIRKEFEFNTRVTSMEWDQEAGRWTICTEAGDVHVAQFVIGATGNLSVPKDGSEFPGTEEFAGETYWTSRWPEKRVDFSGKRVGVIGTGSSGIQVIEAIAGEAGHLTVFQRTPNYAVPGRNRPMTPQEQDWNAENWRKIRDRERDQFFGITFEEAPLPSSHAVSEQERRERYDRMWEKGGLSMVGETFADLLADPDANELAADYVREQIHARVDDPATAELLTPRGYPIFVKRICMENGYFEVYNQDNVELVDVRSDGIARITETGIRTESGAEHDLDVIIFATGFDAVTGAFRNLRPSGSGGAGLDTIWEDGPRTVLGVFTPGLPNLFSVLGPTSASIFYNTPIAIEDHVDVALAAVKHVRESGAKSIEPSAEASESWYRLSQDLVTNSLFPRANSWYMGANVPGKTPAAYLWIQSGKLWNAYAHDIVKHEFAGFLVDGEPRAGQLPPLLKLDYTCARLYDGMLLQGGAPVKERDIQEYRAESAQLSAMMSPPPRDVQVTDASYSTVDGDRLIRVFRPSAGDAPRPVVVFFYGGGFVSGSVEAMDGTLRALADDLGVVVAAPNYRLAPENPFPAATDDALAAVRWVSANIASLGGDPARIIVAGESAGGNLAAVTALRARDDGDPEIAGQILLMPTIDGQLHTASRDEYEHGPLLKTDDLRTMWSYYIGDAANYESPYASPNRAESLAGLPPALIVTAECDPLRDEAEQYGDALTGAGVDTTVVRLPGLIHASFTLASVIPGAKAITEAMGSYLESLPTAALA